MQKCKKFTYKQARLYSGKTQKEIAILMGLSLPTYIKIENYKKSPSLKKFDLFCKLTNQTIETMIWK